ncbi:MAG TPA: M20/M25/M40 family metallo-hydrolase [Patescibacteria group bacterium]|nr:M20/M25/M40 family metallo-hydrolase [Patescibacteria group bacterium]
MNEKLLLNLLNKLVEMPTVTNNFEENNRALDFISQFLEERGMHIVRHTYDGYDAIIATTHVTKNPKVMLVGHCDVVPAPDSEFKVREDGGKLFGRGVWDMKFAIAAYLVVADHLKDHLKDYDFGIMITSDEELQSDSATYLLNDGFLPKIAVLLDGGDNWQLESAAKGAWHVSVTVNGKSAHGSRPWTGDSASFKMLELLGEVQGLFKDAGPNTNTLNISQIQAGEAPNQLPGSATATLDIRLMDENERQRIEKTLFAMLDKYNADYKVFSYFKPLKHNLENPYLKQFSDSIEKVTGIKGVGILSYGASDAANFHDHNIPCIVTRPTGGGHHSDQEWVDKNSFLQLPAILNDYIENNTK